MQRSGNSGASRKAVFIKNNYYNDAFFLKALGESLSPSPFAVVAHIHRDSPQRSLPRLV